MSASITSPAPITYVAALRDMIQSLYGGPMRHNEPELLQFYRRIPEFNDAGPVKIVGIEGHGGALPQYDVINRRFPLKVAQAITGILSKTIFQRPLIRGPFGINLNALHYDDLQWTLEQMAIAGGATKGHKVVFKLFEAQNRPEEYVASLKIIQGLRAKGLDVSCEVAMVISDKPGLQVDHYKGVAESLLSPELFARNGIDPSVVSAFSLKDMIGGVKSSADAAAAGNTNGINARNLAMIAMEAMQRFGDATGHKGLTFGWHTHDIGNALNCLVEAGQTFAAHRGRFTIIKEFQQDVGADGLGFTDLLKLVTAHAANGIVENMSVAQQKILGEMSGYLRQLEERFVKSRIDVSKWNKSLLEYGQLASGGLPYVEKNGITPYVKFVSKMTGPDGQPVGEAKAGEILRCVFASINGVIDNDMGNAHSVTPAMKFLNDLTINAMGGYLQSPAFAQLVNYQTDYSRPLTHENDMADFRANYVHFRAFESMAYFCTPMPTPVSAKILGMLRTRLFNNFFPTDYAGLQKSPDNSSASLLKHLSEADYLRVRGELAGQLMDKEPAKAILIAAGVPEQAASDFAARNIEVNRLPINHGVRAMRERKVEVAVDEAIEKTGGLTVRRPGLERGDNVRLHTTFAAMMLRPKPGMGLADEVASMFKGIFTKRKGWGGAVMETANGNGNGNGNGHYATMPPPRPGVKGKGLAATPATQPTDAASTLHAS